MRNRCGVRRRLRRGAARVVAGELLTPAEVEVLRLVAARPSLTVRDTADALHLAGNTVSTLVGGLAERGLLDRAIMMPLFFASNYPIALMPAWLQAVSHVNPLTYEVDALRGLLVYTPAHLALDFAVLVASAATGIVVAAQLIERLARG